MLKGAVWGLFWGVGLALAFLNLTIVLLSPFPQFLSLCHQIRKSSRPMNTESLVYCHVFLISPVGE